VDCEGTGVRLDVNLDPRNRTASADHDPSGESRGLGFLIVRDTKAGDKRHEQTIDLIAESAVANRQGPTIVFPAQERASATRNLFAVPPRFVTRRDRGLMRALKAKIGIGAEALRVGLDMTNQVPARKNVSELLTSAFTRDVGKTKEIEFLGVATAEPRDAAADATVPDTLSSSFHAISENE
jgi:hypothetical protein